MTQVYTVMSQQARLARAMAGTDEDIPERRYLRRELTSKEKMIARHLARDPETRVADVAAAIGWTLSEATLWKKLKDINIRCAGGRIVAHLKTFDTVRG